MMKTGLASYRDIGSTTLLTILVTLCVSKIHEKTIQIAKHLGRKTIRTDDIEYSILSEWVEENSCYNELRPFMNATMTDGVVEIPEKYKDAVSSAWDEYNRLVIDNIDCPEKLSKACSSVFLADTIFDDNKEGNDDYFGYSSTDDMADDTEESDEEVCNSYKSCECDNCKNIASRVQFFYGLDPMSLEKIDRMMFSTFRNLMD